MYISSVSLIFAVCFVIRFTLQCVRKSSFSFFIAPREIENAFEKRKEFERKSSKSFYLLSSRNNRKKELIEKRSFERKKSFDSFSFFCPWTEKHRVARRNAKKTMGKTTFCDVGWRAPQNLIKPVQYWWFWSTFHGKVHKSMQKSLCL